MKLNWESGYYEGQWIAQLGPFKLWLGSFNACYWYGLTAADSNECSNCGADDETFLAEHTTTKPFKTGDVADHLQACEIWAANHLKGLKEFL